MRRTASKNVNARYVTITVVFCVICLAFLIVLGVIQARGTTLPEREEGYVRTYTVPGLRGEIYDRNGVKIVSNSDSYDLIFEYGAMSDTRKEVNDALLAVMEAVDKTQSRNSLSRDYFVLSGTYPDVKFISEVKDKDSDEYYYYQRFLKNQKMNESKTDADDVAAYFVKRYRLYTSLYTNEEITELMRLYYEMERVGFGQYQSYTIATGIKKELITMVEETGIEGVNFKVRSGRTYLYPGVASHILGRLGKITAENAEYYLERGYSLDAYVGTSGCEEAFEEYLRGTDGVKCVRYSDDGKVIEWYYEVEPKSGQDVYLTIDIELQIAAEEALAENVADIDSSDAGAVTVLDPNSGKVLAIASYPTYDLSRFTSQDYYNSLVADSALPLYNRALQGVYAPGSTYKIGVAMAALELGNITKHDYFNCQREYYPGGPTCLQYHGPLSVVEAIRESCNIFFYNLGERMGIEAITPYTKGLGLGADTGIELGNKTGIVAGPDYRESVGGMTWLTGDDLSAAIGQSDHGYTPLQMSVYMSSVVNGGVRYKVSLLDSVRTFHTHGVIMENEAEVLDRVSFSDDTYDVLIDAMGQVVSGSVALSSDCFGNVPVAVGGKTGTSEVAGKMDYAIFSGFAPLDDPEIVVTCVLEEGVYGSRAAYTVGKVMEKYFKLKDSQS